MITENEEVQTTLDLFRYDYDINTKDFKPVSLQATGQLYFSSDVNQTYKLNWKNDEVESNQFYIKVSDSSIAQPGDDFLLDFALEQYPWCKVSPDDNDINFVAIYDHKMLWRANLYIDESTDDWNDLHPWNAPLTENEWNKDIDGNLGEGDQVVDLTDYPWTRYYSTDNGTLFYFTETRVENRFPYTLGGSDTPFSMVEKLEFQRVLLEHYMKDPELVSTLGNFTGGDENTTWVEPVAPGALESPFIAENSNNWNNYLKTGDQLTVEGTMTYPYRPGYSSVMNDQELYNASQVVESIGADCSGFVQRCADYTGSPYSEINHFLNTAIWMATDADKQTNYSQSTGLLEGVPGLRNASIEIPDIKFLVPGDILTMDGHVVIINDINYSDSVSLNVSMIDVIEAAGTGTQWTINCSRTYQQLISDGYSNIQMRRLIVNE